ncbi:extracellular solute-binding protein [Dictyobacter kobayashii]|uniref:Periplasmic binding protein domain-containing protein n=1 Tax=Dictyobacter kobayashii TaxID=2014872 RepID=A0A402ATJ1_9CHLR|nr:extracellular solute-binding protein [Dictyobacter kobayashii]GCE22412.1 hypothetical protein KDK_62120 [Dictyobacter kobayashii]
MVSEQQGNLDTLVNALQTGRMKRRSFLERALALGLSGSAAASLLAACGETSSTPSSNNPVTLTLWDYFNPAGTGYLALIKDYMKANPAIKIQRTTIPFADLKQKIIQGAAARQLPDIIVIDNPDHSAFASMGILADIISQVTSWGQTNEYFQDPGNPQSGRVRTMASRTIVIAWPCITTKTCLNRPE